MHDYLPPDFIAHGADRISGVRSLKWKPRAARDAALVCHSEQVVHSRLMRNYSVCLPPELKSPATESTKRPQPLGVGQPGPEGPSYFQPVGFIHWFGVG